MGRTGLPLLRLSPVLLLLLLRPSPVLPADAPAPGCPPGRFQCELDAPCFPLEWRCDGHPDCQDEGDERGCATATPEEPSPDGTWATPPWSSALEPVDGAESSATPVPEGSVPLRSQDHMWVLVIAALLSILVAAVSVAMWSLSKAKSRPGIFSVEKVSREQLLPDKSQPGSFP